MKSHKFKTHDLQVRRQSTFDDTFNQLRSAAADQWKQSFVIEFADEEGIDQGGLTKEWLSLLSKSMFDENMALFVRSNQGSTYYPNPRSTVQSDYVQMFKFVGRIIGKALCD